MWREWQNESRGKGDETCVEDKVVNEELWRGGRVAEGEKRSKWENVWIENVRKKAEE